jgi:hypothetical protein
LSVSQASSNAVSNTKSVGGSKELLWKPRIVPPPNYGRFRAISERSAQTRPSYDLPWTITRPNESHFFGVNNFTILPRSNWTWVGEKSTYGGGTTVRHYR